MYSSTIEAHIHYRHTQAEVAALNKAILPLHDSIVAVSSGNERGNMRRILNCNYFRRRDALNMAKMLKRASNYSRAHLDEYFVSMRAEVIASAERLEQALMEYWENFLRHEEAATPTR
jgi:hypothetical protein